jgi:hypothetical protein
VKNVKFIIFDLVLFVDMPGIFSGEYIGFLDPHDRFLTDEGYRTSSYMWNTSSRDIANLEDQFAPFLQDLFHVRRDTFNEGDYRGTVFRFPLRSEGMRSELCQTTYNAEKVRDLFASLEADGHILLLFLKSVETVEVYEKTSPNVPPHRILSIGISPDSLIGVRSNRKELLTAIDASRTGLRIGYVSVTFHMTTELARNSHGRDSATTADDAPDEAPTICDNDSDSRFRTRQPSQRQWIVSHFYDDDAAAAAAANDDDDIDDDADETIISLNPTT